MLSNRTSLPVGPDMLASGLFRNTVSCVEAVGKLLAVLVGRVIGQHLLACGALERLEAGFALDSLGSGILGSVSIQNVLFYVSRVDCKSDIRPSIDFLPPLGQNRPCGRASAVPCEIVNDLLPVGAIVVLKRWHTWLRYPW